MREYESLSRDATDCTTRSGRRHEAPDRRIRAADGAPRHPRLAELKAEQIRIGSNVRAAEERLAAVDAHLAEWQEILETAVRFASNCAKAYARASTQTRRRFNQTVFKRIEVRDGKIAGYECHEPFDVLFPRPSSNTGILLGLRVEIIACYSNRSLTPVLETLLEPLKVA